MIELRPEDIKVDTYRKHGGGGFSANPYTCVRITHLPTGVYAESQDERSIYKNRAAAQTLLKARLALYTKGEKVSIETNYKALAIEFAKTLDIIEPELRDDNITYVCQFCGRAAEYTIDVNHEPDCIQLKVKEFLKGEK